MRKYFLVLLLTPLLGIGQTKTVLTSNRLFAKNDKGSEFEKALANHAQKYHTGDVKWRVWSIESGPDAGGYQINEGPLSWTDFDGRGNLGAAHTADWENTVAPYIAHSSTMAKNVLPLTTGQGQSAYYEFHADLGTVQLTDYADKILINHMTAKPGKIVNAEDLIKREKKVWEVSKESVAVYSAAFSGEPGYITVTRLKDGLKELASDYRKPFAERYNDAYGAGAFDTWLKDYADAVQSRWSELLVYKPGLSSK